MTASAPAPTPAPAPALAPAALEAADVPAAAARSRTWRWFVVQFVLVVVAWALLKFMHVSILRLALMFMQTSVDAIEWAIHLLQCLDMCTYDMIVFGGDTAFVVGCPGICVQPQPKPLARWVPQSAETCNI